MTDGANIGQATLLTEGPGKSMRQAEKGGAVLCFTVVLCAELLCHIGVRLIRRRKLSEEERSERKAARYRLWKEHSCFVLCVVAVVVRDCMWNVVSWVLGNWYKTLANPPRTQGGLLPRPRPTPRRS